MKIHTRLLCLALLCALLASCGDANPAETPTPIVPIPWNTDDTLRIVMPLFHCDIEHYARKGDDEIKDISFMGLLKNAKTLARTSLISSIIPLYQGEPRTLS